MCIWKSWKRPNKRIRELLKLGIEKCRAYMNGNTRKGYCRIAHSGVLHNTLTNRELCRLGFHSLFDSYKSCYV